MWICRSQTFWWFPPLVRGKLFAPRPWKSLWMCFLLLRMRQLWRRLVMWEDVWNISSSNLQVLLTLTSNVQSVALSMWMILTSAKKSENVSITRDVFLVKGWQALLKRLSRKLLSVPPQEVDKHPQHKRWFKWIQKILFSSWVVFDGIEEIVKQRLGEKVIGYCQNNNAIVAKTAHTCKNISLKTFKFGVLSLSWLDACLFLRLLSNCVDDLVRILKEPRNALVKQYQTLLSYDVMLSWILTTKPFKRLLIKQSNGRQGRGLRSIFEETMLDVMFEVPSQENVKLVRITKKKLLRTVINRS